MPGYEKHRSCLIRILKHPASKKYRTFNNTKEASAISSSMSSSQWTSM